MPDGRITVDPTVCFGKPCIRGTRIPVYMVLELLEHGLRAEDITQQCYPELRPDDIKACIHYAAALVKSEEVAIQELG